MNKIDKYLNEETYRDLYGNDKKFREIYDRLGDSLSDMNKYMSKLKAPRDAISKFRTAMQMVEDAIDMMEE